MTYTDVLYDVDNFVATITLNRPDKLNAWTSEMDADVRHAIERVIQSGSDLRYGSYWFRVFPSIGLAELIKKV